MDGRPLSFPISEASLHQQQLEECHAFGEPSQHSKALHCCSFGFDIPPIYAEAFLLDDRAPDIPLLSAADFCDEQGSNVYQECDQWLTDGVGCDGSVEPSLKENEVACQCPVSHSLSLRELSPGTDNTVIGGVLGFPAPMFSNNVTAGQASDFSHRSVESVIACFVGKLGTKLPATQQGTYTEIAKVAVLDKGLILSHNKVATGAINKTELYRQNDKRMWRKKRSPLGPFRELSSGAILVDAVDVAPSYRHDRVAFRVKTRNPNLDDGFIWLKYGQKNINNTIHPRSYLVCKWCKGGASACTVRKQVQRCSDDEDYVLLLYLGKHNHSPPRP